MTLAKLVKAIEADAEAIGRFSTPHFLIAYDDHRAVILSAALKAPMVQVGKKIRKLTDAELAIYQQALILASGDAQ